MKRILSIIFVCVFLISMISGCTQETDPVQPETTPGVAPESAGESLSIVSTIFPQYDWVREILGEKAGNMDLTLLISSTVDLHNYNPSVSDIAKVSTADMFIYVGGDSDDWVEDVLKQAVNPNMVVINLIEVLGDGAKIEEIIEGMQHDHDGCDDEDDCEDTDHDHDHDHDHDDDCDDDDHDHDHDDDCDDDDHDHDHHHHDEDCDDDDCDDDDHDHDHDHDDHDHDHDDHDHHHHHDEVDEHVWLSLRNAVVFCHAIADAISMLDPANADIYAANLAAYVSKLLSLDEEYATVLDNLSNRTLLFADRFPFRYLVDDYDLHYYAAFSGCSAETEASFSTIIFLSQKVDELGLHTVMVTESGNRSIAETVISNSESRNQQILELDSMQAVTMADVERGVTFLSIMESNLLVLKDALS